MKVAVDTNILAYVEGVNGEARRQAAAAVLRHLPEEDRLIPIQVLGELYNVLVRKAGWSPDRARPVVLAWRDAFEIAPTTESAMVSAIDLASDHHLRIWDSVILSVASENGCRLLISEDLQDGFTWRGVTIANPFASQRNPLLVSLLSHADDGH